MNNKKDLYIENSLISSFEGDALFGDIYLEHNSLPEIDFDSISTETEFMGKKISFPLLISSMLGGTERGLEINETLYTIAEELNLPISVGSQEDFIDNQEQEKYFLSNLNDDLESHTFVLSNLSAKTNLEDAKKSMEEIGASGLCLYLNSAQTVTAYDDKADFTGVLDNIGKLSNEFTGKLMVKEKSMGMSIATVKKLASVGVKYIDISGFGGTNFMELENLRNYRNDYSDLYEWGIPTAKAIINARQASSDVKIIASGGIKSGLDIVKSLVLGADYVAVAGELLKYTLHGGYSQAKAYLEDLIHKTKVVMFLLGVDKIEDLKNVDYKITGKLKDILEWQT